MEQFLKIKKLLDTNLSISYKSLSIGMLFLNGQKVVQVDCDKYDLIYSQFYTLENINFAISKFTILLTKYIASELKNGG